MSISENEEDIYPRRRKDELDFLAGKLLLDFVYGDDDTLIDPYIKIGGAINYKFRKNDTLLHLAAQRNYEKCIRKIFKYRADINAMNDENMTPLCVAMQNKKGHAFKIILELGADITILPWGFQNIYEYINEINYPESIVILEKYMSMFPEAKPASKRR